MDGKQLKAFREMMGLKQEELADLLGYTRRQYQKLEQGEIEIRGAVRLACAALALGIYEYDGPMAEYYMSRRITRRKKDHVP